MTTELSKREELVLTEMLSDLRSNAFISLKTAQNIGPDGNQDTKALFEDFAKLDTERANALLVVLKAMGIRGLGEPLVL